MSKSSCFPQGDHLSMDMVDLEGGLQLLLGIDNLEPDKSRL